MKKPGKKKIQNGSELTREQAKIEFGKRMNDFVLVPVGKKKNTKTGKK